MSSTEIQENREAQSEEMQALQAIYENDCTISSDHFFCKIKVVPFEDGNSFEPLHLTTHFPELYPSSVPPVVEIEAAWLHDNTRERIIIELQDIFKKDIGNVVVFKWIDWLKGLSWLWEEARSSMEYSRLKNTRKEGKCCTPECESALNREPEYDQCESSSMVNTNVPLEELEKIYGIVHGLPFTEKKSTFQAHLASVTSPDQVKAVIEALLQNRKISAATHNIMAYRIVNSEKGTILQDYDDDGETAAGGRLLHLLQIVDATNVMVVVSRWFGGILLGPNRFKHINNAARSLLVQCGYIKGEGVQNCTQQTQDKFSNRKEVLTTYLLVLP